MAKIDELKQEAKELNISFSPNISEAKLQERINEFYEAEEKKADEKIEAEIKAKESFEENKKGADIKSVHKMGDLARKMEAKARKTKVVTIVDNDQRENNFTTTVSVNCGNEWFDLGQMILPLNTPVEVMQGHIDVIKEVEIPMHVKDPKTGLSRLELRKRYSVSFEDMKA